MERLDVDWSPSCVKSAVFVKSRRCTIPASPFGPFQHVCFFQRTAMPSMFFFPPVETTLPSSPETGTVQLRFIPPAIPHRDASRPVNWCPMNPRHPPSAKVGRPGPGCQKAPIPNLRRYDEVGVGEVAISPSMPKSVSPGRRRRGDQRRQPRRKSLGLPGTAGRVGVGG